MRVVVCALALVAVASAVPVAHHRLMGKLKAAGALQARVPAPELSGSFHTAYSLYLLKMDPLVPLLADLSDLLNRGSHLLDGEAWQNIDSNGVVTIKTVNSPAGIGGLIVPETTSTWVRDHGWTENHKHKTCTVDKTNPQLVIPGTILKSTGVFKGTKKIRPIKKQDTPKPDDHGLYTVDQWDATLPNGEGSVSYYLLHGVVPPTPIMSHYVLKGKPPAWAQYTFFKAGTNPDSVYAPTPSCAQAAAAGRSAPPTSSNAAPAPVAKTKL